MKTKLFNDIIFASIFASLSSTVALAQVQETKIDELNKRYDLVIPIRSDWYEVERNGLCGLVDKDLREVIAPSHTKLRLLNNNLVQVSDKSNKVSILRTNGTPIQLPAFEEVYVDKNGWIGIRQAEKWGSISPTANHILAPKYNNLISFEQGGSMARVEIAGTWGFVDTTLTEVVPMQYRFVHPFSEGLARVNKRPR